MIEQSCSNSSAGPAESIDGLMYRLHAEMEQDSAQQMNAGKDLLQVYLKKAREYRHEKINRLKAKEGVEGNKEKMKKQVAVLSAMKGVKQVEKWIKSLFANLQGTVSQEERQDQRILRILNDLDEGKTTALQEDRGGVQGPAGASVNGGGAVGQALKAEIGIKHDLERERETKQDLQSRRVEGEIDEQKQGIQKVLGAMKKSKLFGRLFEVFSQIAGIVVSALTMGAGSPLGMALSQCSKFVQALVPQLVQSAYGTLMQTLGTAMMRPFQKQMQNGQLQQQNARLNLDKMVKRVVEDDENAQHSLQKNQKLIDDLEGAQTM